MDKPLPFLYTIRLRFSRGFRKKRYAGFICLVTFFLIVAGQHTMAEGSKELTANGGYRAYLFSSDTATSSYPFPTRGTVKVYVKAGETIFAGSSAQGYQSGTMNFRAPDGTTYTSGNSTTTGFIANRSQEIAGPVPNSGGYTPYKITAGAAQEGVWEVDFISPNNGGNNGIPPPVAAGAEWLQYYSEYITAFDVSVRDAANTRFLTGRVFTNVYMGVVGNFVAGFNAVFHIITSDGYQYTLNNNGQAGDAFTFFVNNKGFRNADGTPSYKSVNTINADSLNVQDPRAPDAASDITQKIFFNTLAADLPASAKTPAGHTWLLSTPVAASLSAITVKGVEGTTGLAGTAPLGANFTFTSTVAGSILIAIDVNGNGVFTDAIDRRLTGNVIAGANQVYWNGLDGAGNKVPAGAAVSLRSSITIAVKAGEVHFPFFDVERNANGIILTRLNGSYAPDDTLYWDDSQIPVIGTPSSPVTNLTGISSKINGHRWGKTTTDPGDDQDFGNNKSLDTWSFIGSAPLFAASTVTLREADLETDSLKIVADCAGQPVLFTFSVRNNGPNDVSGAKVSLNIPATVTGITVSSQAVTGASSVSGEVIGPNGYSAMVSFADSSVRAFVIKGKVAPGAAGSLTVTAGILRPADITDPDATNPDPAVPADALAECDAQPSGRGCNNVKTGSVQIMEAADAGAGQTVNAGAAITLAGNGTGTWSQAVGDPSAAMIASPASASTTVTGLVNTGAYHFIYTNISGCADTVIINVVITSLDIPNIFTPNGDGKNDLFVIKGLESFPGSRLLIFNRWGNEVYKADNYLNDWDGSGLAEGTYYYILDQKESNGTAKTYKGWVFLKRTR